MNCKPHKKFLCKCGETDPSKFVNKGQGRLAKSLCKACHSKNCVKRLRRNRIEVIKYFGGRCMKCGYNRCIAALHFHHLNPKKKDPNWNYLRFKSLEKQIKELKKCILLCSNCHEEEHHGTINPQILKYIEDNDSELINTYMNNIRPFLEKRKKKVVL